MFWEPEDIPSLLENCTKEPRTDYELFQICSNKLNEIKNEVEAGDVSLRHFVRPDDLEVQVRRFIKYQLDSKSNQLFVVPQEVEIDPQNRPDIRVEKSSLNPVSIEVKKAENWSFNELVEGLKGQLVGKYLKTPSHTYGIYVLGYVDAEKKSYWKDEEGQQYDFHELISKLNEIALGILKDEKLVFGLNVVGIDFRAPE